MMGQIEVLYDLGEPYVRLEDYRAVQARAATLAAEVERLEVDRDEWMETAETTEEELCRFMDDLIAVVGEQVIVGDEVKFSAIVTAVAALRAQLEAAQTWRKTKTDPPADQQWVQTRTTSFGTYHAEDGYFHVDGVYGWYESEWRPAPPQE